MNKILSVLAIVFMLGCHQAVYPPPVVAQEEKPVVEPVKSATVLRLELKVIQGKMAAMQLQFPALQAKETELIAQLKQAAAREKREKASGKLK